MTTEEWLNDLGTKHAKDCLAELESLTKERDELKKLAKLDKPYDAAVARLMVKNHTFQSQLTAAQAENVRLREALEGLSYNANIECRGTPIICSCYRHKALRALASTTPNPIEQESSRIYTRCPACHNDTLVLNKGHLLCTWFECPDPTSIDEIWKHTPKDSKMDRDTASKEAKNE